MEERIRYDSRTAFYKTPFGCLRQDEPCRITLGVPKSCPIRTVTLILEAEGGQTLTVLAEFSGESDGYGYYTASFSLDVPGLYFYYFLLRKEDSSFRLFRLGDGDTNMEEGEKWQLTCLPKEYHPPHSLAGTVMYQIFPDRFAKNGEADLSEKLRPYHLHADRSEPPVKGPDEDGNWNCDFYGGNLRGIEERLPYLKELGVGLIYLNPIFYAASNHRYDTADYLRLDPMLGTEDDFVSLCRAAKEQGIKILLDGVFSHVGANSRYFDRDGLFGGGAVSDPSSPYRDWFDFRSFPDDYDCWWEVKNLPCVKEMTPSFLDLIIRGEDSVVAHWMRLGASGFRLDVADELPDEFIALLRTRVKELNPEGLVIGEVWEDASNKWSYGKRRRYFCGGELDGVMNYPFRTAILDLLCGKMTGKNFVSQILTLYENYPREALNCSMTFLGTHDTPRVLTELKETLGERAVSALKAASALLYFLPGMPCIYYGDEVGMEGGGDPENRAFYAEGEAADELLPHYRWLGRLRCEHEALRVGELSLTADGDTVTVTRSLGKETASLTLCLSDLSFQIEI